MSRPCGNCNNYRPGQPFDTTRDCRLCWLYHNDERYRQFWDHPNRPKRTRKRLDYQSVGPGTQLKKMLSWFYKPSANCKCDARVKQMNSWGAAGCRMHTEEILGWLQESAAEKGIPAPRWALARLLETAIRKAEKALQTPRSEP